MSEERLGHLSGWIRRRPSSLEFWELFLTTDRLVLCFVGESFSSALLRADMGENARRELEELTIDEIAAYEERNVEIPVKELSAITLTRGSRLKRPRLEVVWDGGERTLYSTKTSDSGEEVVETLAKEPRLADVSVEIRDPSSFLDRL
jgi:hypothetical protein